MITVASIPAALKNDKQVVPFIARSEELYEMDPIISYFCRMYVMSYLVTNDLHHLGEEISNFVELVMEDTEPVHMSHHDPSIRSVLASKQKSINYVFLFALKVYNGCLEDLNKYDGTNKATLATKLRAAINFWTLLSIFTFDNEEPLDFSLVTGGQTQSKAEFMGFIRDKLKATKFQLSRLLKDKVPIKKTVAPEEKSVSAANDSIKSSCNSDPKNDSKNDPKNDSKTDLSKEENASKGTEPDSNNVNDIKLPGAPRFDPGADSEEKDSSWSLPGAPKFLPDDDPSSVIKNASIQVFSPGEIKEKEGARPKAVPQRTASSGIVTQEALHNIIDTNESIGKIQKHAKFAISALNYEDFDTAEAELIRSLGLLRSLRQRA